MIKWSHSDDGDNEYTLVAAHLLLFAKLSQHSDDSSTPARVIAVIQSLSQSKPKPGHLLKLC
jgi:hypothetical protein